MVYSFGAPQFVHVSESQRLSLAQKMQAAIESNVPTAGDLYKLDAAAFAACRLAMISAAEEALGNGLREIHESKVGFFYLDARGEWRATTSRLQAEALEGVWLSDEDVRNAKDNGQDLRVIYQLRCMNRGRRQRFEAADLEMP